MQIIGKIKLSLFSNQFKLARRPQLKTFTPQKSAGKYLATTFCMTYSDTTLWIQIIELKSVIKKRDNAASKTK